jgi:hypothetical protein
VYRLSDSTQGTRIALAGIELDAAQPAVWVASTALMLAGLLALRFAARFIGGRWDAVQAELRAA